MFDIAKILRGGDASLARDKMAKLLETTPEALAAFEKAYQTQIIDAEVDTGSIFDISSKQASAIRSREEIAEEAKRLNGRIIGELLAQTPVMTYDGKQLAVKWPDAALGDGGQVTLEEIQAIPEEIRPQLSGFLMKKDVPGDTAGALLFAYKSWLEAKTQKKKQMYYGMFRRGLDTLDLDGISYEILGMNKNSMGYWLPALIEGVQRQGFFKVPRTKIIKVPLPMLQLSRLDYQTLTPGTMDIVDRFCLQAFDLDESRDYFIKTGTYSSKFDFRNAKVSGAKEVRELGEYLLFIQHQAVSMASYLATPSIYGVSTTNEWVVREFIQDVENNPTIYKGLPLHTEYRVFVDFDTDTVLGMNPYWDPDVMKQRFGHEEDADSPHQVHDYVIYAAHEKVLADRYQENAGKVREQLEKMLPSIQLPGQWSVDVMQNGDDFFIIDMALAETSALKECVPAGLLRPQTENWLPRLPKPGEKRFSQAK